MHPLLRRTFRVGVPLVLVAAASAASVTSASALSIDSTTASPTYSALEANTPSYFQHGNAMAFQCTRLVINGATGNVPGDPASTDFRPTITGPRYNYDTSTFDACSTGLSADLAAGVSIVATSDWRLTAAGPAVSDEYPLKLTVAMRWAQQWFRGQNPTATCLTTFDPQANVALSGLRGRNTPSGLRVTGTVTGLTHTVYGPGCVFFRRNGTYTDGRYTTTFTIPGVRINP